MSPEWKTSGWGIGRHKLRSHLLLSVAVFVITVSSPAAAEPPAQLSAGDVFGLIFGHRSEEHTSELQSLMRISYAVFCLKKKKQHHSDIYITLDKLQTSESIK